MKKFLLIAGSAVAAALLLMAAAVITLVVMFPPEKIKALVIPQVEKALGRQVQVQGAGISLFPVFGVKLTGLQIANTGRPGFSKEPFVTLKQFALSINVLSLVARKVDIGTIMLDEPCILVEMDTKGSYNFDDLAVLAKKEETPSGGKKPSAPLMLPIPITLERFIIKQGSVVYNDMKGKTRIDLGNIDQRVNISIDKELKNIVTTGELKVSGISLYSKDVPKPITGLVVTFSHDLTVNVVEGRATVNSIKVSLQKLSIGISGAITDLNNKPRLDLALKTDRIMVKDILAEIPAAMVPEIGKIQGEGSIQLELKVAGVIEPKKNPALRGLLSVRDVTIKYSDLPKSLNSFNADVSFTEDELNVGQFALKFGDNPITLKAKVQNFAKPDVDAELRMQLNLDDVKDMVKLPAGTEVGGALNAQIRVQGRVDPADPAKADITGLVELKNVRVVTPEVAKPLTVNGKIELSADEIRNAMGVAVGDSKMDITLDVRDFLTMVLPDSTKKQPRTRVKLELRSAMLNVDDLLPKAEAPAEKAPESQTPQEPALLLAAPLPGVDLKADIRCDRLIYSGIPLSAVRLDVEDKNNVADVDLRAGLYGGDVKLKLNTDVRNNRNIRFTTKFEVDDVQMNDFVSGFNDKFTGSSPLGKLLATTDNVLYGKLSAEANLSGSGGTMAAIESSLGGTVTADAREGRIAGGVLVRKLASSLEKFATIDEIEYHGGELRATIANGSVNIDTVRMQTKFGDLGVNGTVGLDASYDLMAVVRLTKEVSDRLLAAEGQLKDAATNALKGVNKQLASLASKALDNAHLIPVDRDGRVIVKRRIRGTGQQAEVESAGYGGKGAQAEETPKQQAKAAAQEKVDEVKQQAAEVVKQEVNQAANEAQKVLQESKTTEDLKKNAEKAGKKLLQGLKF